MSFAVLKAQQEATLDGILVVDNDRRVISYNRRFLELWKIEPSAAGEANDDRLVELALPQIADVDTFVREVAYLYDHPAEIRKHDEILLKDGRTLSRATVPLVAESGSVDGRVWYFRDVTDVKRAELLQSALFRIAEVAHSAEDLDQLYRSIHSIVGELMDVTNFYIALLDSETHLLRFPYFVDQYDQAPDGIAPGRGLTGYVLRTGTPLLADPEKFDRMQANGDVDAIGEPSVDWLGVPLKSGDETYGVLGLQSYDERVRYTEQDLEILDFVSKQISSAIDHKRKEDDLRASETRYRQMFENNSAVKLVIDPDTGSIVDANQAATEFYGYSLEEIRKKTIFDINTADPAVTRERLHEAKGVQRTYPLFMHRLRSGEIRQVEVHTGPFSVGGRTLLHSIIHDITERKLAEEALRQAEQKYRNIFSFASVGIYQSTTAGDLITANPRLVEILGYDSVEELLQQNLERDVYVQAEERRSLIAQFALPGANGGREVRWRRKDGSEIWVKVNAHSLRKEEDGTSYFEGFVEDITSKIDSERIMRTQAVAMEASMDGIAIIDATGRFTYLNHAFARLYGYVNEQQLLGKDWRRLVPRRETGRILREVVPAFTSRGQWRGEGVGLRRSLTIFPLEMSLTRIEAGNVVAVVRDITERTYAEEQIKHLAYHDALTGLPNRLLFKDRLTVALSHAQRADRKLAVLFLDLDRFKIINDSLGHNAGDLLLQNVAARLQACVRESDTVARLGGDEFTLLLPMLTQPEDASRVAQKILESVRGPYDLGDREIYATTSIGISIFPEDGMDSDTLIKNADTAMYQAKESGRNNFQLFNAAINAKALERLALENGLRKALANGEFVLHYQPIYDLRSGRIHSMEALLRWQHPDLGLIAPNHFIPLAESTGLMVPIGAWVLEEACRQTRRWHDGGLRDLTVAVNLSVSQLQHGDLAAVIRQVLDRTGLAPGFLGLEITESGAMLNPENSIRTLDEMKKLGVHVSLDDFGIGHSSLSYLKRFPIDTLKIDQSFVRDITHDGDTAAIVTAIIAMGHKLRLDVVAEGVEAENQRHFLNENQCDKIQGFLFHPPVPADEFEKFLREHRSRSRKWPEGFDESLG